MVLVLGVIGVIVDVEGAIVVVVVVVFGGAVVGLGVVEVGAEVVPFEDGVVVVVPFEGGVVGGVVPLAAAGEDDDGLVPEPEDGNEAVDSFLRLISRVTRDRGGGSEESFGAPILAWR